MVLTAVGVACLFRNAQQYNTPAYVTRSAVACTCKLADNESRVHRLLRTYFIIIFLSCVICSHHHETGCTAAAEAQEVAVPQVPVFSVTTVFNYDILLNCF
jgi:hypothetical protein